MATKHISSHREEEGYTLKTLMEKYSKVPQWWFLVILAVNAALALLAAFAVI
ncbi:hypothetical protein Syun_013452 [Stephania yunnanensis]|uniref:Uncharacterized protein n=1 Tax=Stephania yunnanensis TaxID=152371 RepID=A0AAP0PHC6_9MAGN